MNKGIMTGRLVADPEQRTTKSGKSEANFRIAVERKGFNDQNGNKITDFFKVICWSGVADSCMKYLHKGDKVLVEGMICNRTYKAQDGSDRFVVEIFASSVEFLTPKGSTNPAPVQQAATVCEYEPVDDDQLPF